MSKGMDRKGERRSRATSLPEKRTATKKRNGVEGFGSEMSQPQAPAACRRSQCTTTDGAHALCKTGRFRSESSLSESRHCRSARGDRPRTLAWPVLGASADDTIDYLLARA
jgi:hypothetical protein